MSTSPLRGGHPSQSPFFDTTPTPAVPDWPAKLAALQDRLLALGGDAYLSPDATYHGASLRFSAVLIDTLAGRGEPAWQALARPIRYDIPPPPGGWTIFDGSPDVRCR